MKLAFQTLSIQFFLCLFVQVGLVAGNGVCFKCEEIREHNKLHNNNYEYYDDYIKEKEGSLDGQDKTDISKPSKNSQHDESQQKSFI